jgi:hypothetical protein
MSAPMLSTFETIEQDDGVLVTRSSRGLHVHLPTPETRDHELRVVAVLWRLWCVARIEGGDEEVRWTIRFSDHTEQTGPLINMLSAIDAELRRTGHRLIVMGGEGTSSKTVSGR